MIRLLLAILLTLGFGVWYTSEPWALDPSSFLAGLALAAALALVLSTVEEG